MFVISSLLWNIINRWERKNIIRSYRIFLEFLDFRFDFRACKNCSFGTHEDCLHPQCVTVDGYERGVQTINRVIPGTAIEVCLNDNIVVDLENKMEGTGVSIHWHGIHHRQTPFMDGVPYVTQCPIAFESTFRYAFKATQAGTHFYHSHAGT